MSGTDPEKVLKHRVKIKGSGRLNGRTFRSALDDRALVFNNKNNRIVIFQTNRDGNLEEKLSIKTEKPNIIDHQIFGQSSDKIALLSSNGYLQVFKLSENFEKVEKMGSKTVKIAKNEEAISLAVGPMSKYIAIHTRRSSAPFSSSKIIILELTSDNKLEHRETFKFPKERIGFLQSFNFLGYIGQKLLITGLSRADSNSKLMTFYFNTEKGGVAELKDLRRNLVAKNVEKIYRVGAEGDMMFKAVDRKSRILTFDYCL